MENMDDENFNDINNNDVDIVGGKDDPVIVEQPRNAINTVWEDDHFRRIMDENGNPRWKCLWCDTTFAGWNATKALYHVVRVRGFDIAPCSGTISYDAALKYKALYDGKVKKRESISSRKATIKRVIDNSNVVAANELEKRQSAKKSKIIKIPNEITTSSTTTVSTTKETTISTTKGNKDYIQLKLTGECNPTAESKLSMAIADFIHGCGLPFTVSTHPKFRKVISLARAVGVNYKVPSRQRISNDLLEINYDTYQVKTKDMLIKDINVFGLSFYGDGATVRKMPLTNILASGAYLQTGLLEIVDATPHLSSGGKKDACYISGLFRPHINDYERECPNSVDFCSFDGAANVQKAGEILQAHFPRIVVSHGAEHVLSLFFQDAFKLPILAVMSKIVKKTYVLFGSGAMHQPYALFQKHSKIHNNGKNIGMFRSAGTRMGGEVIALMRMLRLQQAFLATIQSPEFIKLTVSSIIVMTLTNVISSLMFPSYFTD
jgi:hypothetical protein